jgi:hypothetical protein
MTPKVNSMRREDCEKPIERFIQRSSVGERPIARVDSMSRRRFKEIQMANTKNDPLNEAIRRETRGTSKERALKATAKLLRQVTRPKSS